MSNILTEVGTNEVELMSFYLNFKSARNNRYIRSCFGINAAKVKELATVPTQLTVMPQSHPFIEGVFVLRNHTIALINLSKYFGYVSDESDEAKKKWVVIIVELSNRKFGILAHGVDKVYRISWEQIEPPPPYIAQFGRVVSVVTIDNKIIQMLDFENIITEIDPGLAVFAPHNSENAALGKEVKEDVSPKRKPEKLEAKDRGTLLIAEDSKIIRDQMKKTLESSGYEVREFSDGLHAWEALCQIKKACSSGRVKDELTCVITDIEMPRMDGHHLCKRIKSDQAFNGIPVLLFSSLINYHLFKKGEEVGADDQITKPELNELIRRIQVCIERYQGAHL